MGKYRILHQSFEDVECKLPGIWNKSWVRPYESIWSILNNYKAVNVIYDHATLMKAIGTNTRARVVSDYFISYGIFCNISSNINDINDIISNLVPEWYKNQTEEVFSKRDISDFFSDKINYCPKCMKNGYHSILHQLKGLQKCPFHKKESLVTYLKQRYVFGAQAPYTGDHKNLERLKIACRNVGVISTIDFENPSQFPLPVDRKNMPEITEFFQELGLRKDFDYIKPIAADIFDKNIIPEIGSFLLNYELKPDIIIQNIKEADTSIIEKMNRRIKESGIVCQKNLDSKHRISFKYIYMQVFVVEKLMPYTYDEIDYKCYQIERGRFISYDDELGILLLYLLYVTGDERIEDSLSVIRETNQVKSKYSAGYRYYPSELCIHELDISSFCIAAQYYILEDYMNTNFIKFMEYAKELGGMKKPLMRGDLILCPAHMIYVEQNEENKLYRY